ncbi:MAG: hypothetical protein ACRD4D_05710 [Candidatus Acidiferrales bacterium]
MASAKDKSEKAPTGAELRRSQRVLMAIPVHVAWSGRSGDRVEEEAVTEIVNAHGALLRMKAPVALGTEVEVTHGHTKKTSKGVVVYAEEPEKGKRVGVGLELEASSHQFWGISIPPPQRSAR